MATCSVSELIDQACANKFNCGFDEKTFRALLLQLVCNLTSCCNRYVESIPDDHTVIGTGVAQPLFSFTVPAGTLVNQGDFLTGFISGNGFSAAPSTFGIRCRHGSDVLFEFPSLTTGSDWVIQFCIILADSPTGTTKSEASMVILTQSLSNYSTSTIDWTIPNTLVVETDPTGPGQITSTIAYIMKGGLTF